MNDSVTANTFESWFDLFNFDFTPSQLIQDADLIRQLPFIPGLKEILLLRQVHGLEHATVWVLSESVGKMVDNEL